MRVIIAGSRDLVHYENMLDAIAQSGFNITEVVSGSARRMDRLCEAYSLNTNIIATKFPVDSVRFGRFADYVRAIEMVEYSDALIAIWDGSSRGVERMLRLAEKAGLVVFIYNPSEWDRKS